MMIGYQDTVKAVRIHVDDEDKIKFENLLKTRCVSTGQEEQAPLDWNDKNTIYVNESGLYSLILRSNKPEAKPFKRWITFTVLPSLRKTGQYGVQDDQSRFNPQLNNPTGERKLHYKVIRHIQQQHPCVIIIPGLGENQSTEFKRIDSHLKGYTSGQPDIILLSKYGSYTDVICIELKCPEKKIILPKEQLQFHQPLETINVDTLVSNNYDEVIIFLHEHYKTLAEKANTQPQQQSITLPYESFDFFYQQCQVLAEEATV